MGTGLGSIQMGMLIETVGLNTPKTISGITSMIIAIWWLINGFKAMENGTG